MITNTSSNFPARLLGGGQLFLVQALERASTHRTNTRTATQKHGHQWKLLRPRSWREKLAPPAGSWGRKLHTTQIYIYIYICSKHHDTSKKRPAHLLGKRNLFLLQALEPRVCGCRIVCLEVVV